MNRQQKESVVDIFHKDFLANKGTFFVNYSGLTVNEMQQLRRQLRQKGGALKIAKMRLVKRALADVEGAEGLLSHCKNQIGVVFAFDAAEVSGVAKTLNDFAKGNEALGLVIGCVDARLLDKAAITRIASLPSKEVLLAQLCGTLNAPLTSFVFGLNSVMVKFLLALKEVEKQKQS
ncbi:MAG TPA: 50S ribosomal protein L10 [Candidatus Babeliales bacterium]|jgi:large subunit ribosomal protein L10|nr:50S ribosomal protein L10 [Candidatus Babeliales bacterium]